MRNKRAGLWVLTFASALVVGLLAGAPVRAQAAETLSDRVVDSLLLRASTSARETPGETTPRAAVDELPKILKESSRKPIQGGFMDMGRLKSLGVAGLILGGLVLLGLGAWRNGWRLKARGSYGPAIRLVSMKPLGDKKAIAVVDVEGQRLVVGMTPQQVTLLTSLPAGKEEGRGDYTLGGAQEPTGMASMRWKPPAADLDFGKTSYPDLQGLMSALRG